MPSRSVRHDGGTARAARRASTAPGARSVLCAPTSIARDGGRSRSSSAGQAGVGAAVVGDLQRLDLRQRRAARGHVGLGVGGQQQVEGAVRATSATIARSFGSPSGAAGRGGGGHSTRSRERARAEHLAGLRGDAARAAGAPRPAARAATGVGQPAPPSSTQPRPATRAMHRRRAALVVGLGVREHQHVEPRARPTRAAAARSGRPAARCRPARRAPSRWISVASPWPTSRNDDHELAGRRRRGRARRATRPRASAATRGRRPRRRAPRRRRGRAARARPRPPRRPRARRATRPRARRSDASALRPHAERQPGRRAAPARPREPLEVTPAAARRAR